jgi:acyl-CoA reductase-like NAD-dependent aldehyde dehydrogenase
MLHVPALRAGKPYKSININTLPDVRTGEPVAEVSQVNAGLVARDLGKAEAHRQVMAERSTTELLAICKKAADLFMTAELPVDPDSGTLQSPEDFVQIQSATTGMPQALCRGNMQKTRFVMAEMETVLGGLTRGLDLKVLDEGYSERDGRMLSYVSVAKNLGAVLPSNSPGVHSLWIPAVAMKVPLVLKPGSQEPWTPTRILQALKAAGCPDEALGFYPTDYSGAREILLRTDRSMIFGDESTVRPWKHDSRVQLHGPGWSKIALGNDRADHWQDHVDLMVTSIAENGGRACLNASGVWVPKHGKKVARALAERLGAIKARPLDDPAAALSAFSNPVVAHKISEYIDRLLAQGGAEDLTARHRDTERVVEVDGCTFLLPTLIWCEDASHPLASTELLFPFASVVQVPQDEMIRRMGATLVLTAVTDDPAFKRELMNAENVDRLNLGEFPSSRVSWDQPHEGNLFEHLYRQRAFQTTRNESAA